MARPPKKIKRDAWLPKVRVSRVEFDAISSRRRRAGLNMSAFIRTAAMEGAIIQRDDGAADKKLIAGLLGALGNNLNQLTRRANIQGDIDPMLADALQDTLAHVRELLGSVTVDS